MRMVCPFTRSRFERVSTRDNRAAGCAQRKQHRLFQRVRPDVGGEWLAIHEHVHAVGSFVGHDRDAWLGVKTGGNHQSKSKRTETGKLNWHGLEPRCDWM